MEKIFERLLHILKMSMGRYQRITQPATKPTPQIYIYYGTWLKRIMIFRLTYKKRKWLNHHRYLLQTIRHPTIPHFKSHDPKNCIKSILYTLARTIHTIITNKNLKRTRHNELHTTVQLRGYPTTLINKGLELAEKIPPKELRNLPKIKTTWNPVAYVVTYNNNYLELFTEIIKNIVLKNKNKIKEILDITKIIKSQRQHKNLKRILTFSTFGENTTQGITKCNNKPCKICDIMKSKSYTFKNPETKFKINKN